jgi:hypothetical protein
VIPEHLARYAHPRVDALKLLHDAREYADSLDYLNPRESRLEGRRIFNAINEALALLGAQTKPRKEYE